MKNTVTLMIFTLLVGSGFSVLANVKDMPQNNRSVTDSDSDGIADAFDNCTLVSNTDQRDTDGDGYGNICDADLNNDLIVNTVDLGLFRSRFFTADPDADLNGNGVVNATDLGLFRTLYFLPPGPSAVGYLAAPSVDVNGNEGIINMQFVDTNGNFELVWSTSNGAASYTVTQSLNGGAATVIAAVPVGGPNMINFNSAPNGDYVFQVEACDAGGQCGPASESVNVIVENLN